MDARTPEGTVAGTGPYVARECVSGSHLTLTRNDSYWGGEPGLDGIEVRVITDPDTLTLALRGGELDASFGLPHETMRLFENDQFRIARTESSRVLMLWMNYLSPVASDKAVRLAIAMGIDRESYVRSLLGGNGYVGEGAFPTSSVLNAGRVKASPYDPDRARELLENAGWTDTDGDGVRERGGVPLRVRWLTYPSRRELPMLAEYAQAQLKQIGIDVQIDSTASHNAIKKDSSQWDVYASSMMTASTGDPEAFFVSCCLDDSAGNVGHFQSDVVESLAVELSQAFDSVDRIDLGVRMQQELLDDGGYAFCVFLPVTTVSRSYVTGYDAHVCDYYLITSETRMAGE